MIKVYKIVSKAALTDATVIIEGESGTGKEVLARMIHRNSRRMAQAFVPVDSGSIASSLESNYSAPCTGPTPAQTAIAWGHSKLLTAVPRFWVKSARSTFARGGCQGDRRDQS